jgi:hypothetical protein
MQKNFSEIDIRQCFVSPAVILKYYINYTSINFCVLDNFIPLSDFFGCRIDLVDHPSPVSSYLSLDFIR